MPGSAESRKTLGSRYESQLARSCASSVKTACLTSAEISARYLNERWETCILGFLCFYKLAGTNCHCATSNLEFHGHTFASAVGGAGGGALKTLFTASISRSIAKGLRM